MVYDKVISSAMKYGTLAWSCKCKGMAPCGYKAAETAIPPGISAIQPDDARGKQKSHLAVTEPSDIA